MADPEPGELTVEQLAFETGMSVRNIRNHQSRGLLQPPEVRARTGYYGPQHVARLRLIQEMQAEGYNLKAIQRLIGEHGASADQFIEIRRAISAPAEAEAPEVLTADELQERVGSADPKLLAKAIKLGILVPARRRPLRGAQPRRAAGGRGGDRARCVAGGRAGGDRAGQPQRALGVEDVREALPGGGLGALRGGRPPRRSLARDHRVDRAAAARLPPRLSSRSSARR